MAFAFRKRALGRGKGKGNQCTDPIKWNKYWRYQETVETPSGSFMTYGHGNDGPVVFALHGGGYSALTWSLFARHLIAKIQIRFVALDIRGHGNTSTTDENNLNIVRLATDVREVLAQKFGDEVPIIMIGHSMGGCIAVEVASSLPNLIGLIVIDVVEGTAVEALSSMQSVLRGRPRTFDSPQHAILWGIAGGSSSNVESARVSIPGQIINVRTGKLASDEVDSDEQPTDTVTEPTVTTSSDDSFQSFQPIRLLHHCSSVGSVIHEVEPHQNVLGSIATTTVEDASTSTASSAVPEDEYTWRIDLSKTIDHWQGWFQGMSQKFLDVPAPKLLLLQGVSGLDTTLTIGQMQGKFQVQVLQRCGHAMHEDLPEDVAEIVAGFLIKQKLVERATTGIVEGPGTSQDSDS